MSPLSHGETCLAVPKRSMPAHSKAACHHTQLIMNSQPSTFSWPLARKLADYASDAYVRATCLDARTQASANVSLFGVLDAKELLLSYTGDTWKITVTTINGRLQAQLPFQARASSMWLRP